MVQCAQCKTTTIIETDVYYTRTGVMLGEWPIYYVGNPIQPHNATAYFCGVYCSNNYYKELRND
jgi:hypothetical protein